jgi:pyrroloquinoline quinone biosynthesis protein E
VCSKSAHHGVILAAREEAERASQGMQALTMRNEKASRLILKV